MSTRVLEVGPVVTMIPGQDVTVDLAVEVEGWDGKPLHPCRWCGSTGQCEHLLRVVHVGDGNGGQRPVPVRAEMGAGLGERRIADLVGELAWIAWQGEKE